MSAIDMVFRRSLVRGHRDGKDHEIRVILDAPTYYKGGYMKGDYLVAKSILHHNLKHTYKQVNWSIRVLQLKLPPLRPRP